MLKEIKLKGFKRHSEEVTLSNLGVVNFLVGPNSCGKSSILQALFLIKLCKLKRSEPKVTLLLRDPEMRSLFMNTFEMTIKEGEVKEANGTYIDSNKEFTLKIVPEESDNESITFECIFERESFNFMNSFFVDTYQTHYIDTNNFPIGQDLYTNNWGKNVMYHSQTLNQSYDFSPSRIAILKKTIAIIGEILKNIEKLLKFSSGGEKQASFIFTIFEQYCKEKSVMFLIEEPENSLHSTGQKKLIFDIEKIIRKYQNDDDTKIQLFLSTHSPFILSQSFISDVHEDPSRHKFYNIYSFTPIEGNGISISSIDELQRTRGYEGSSGLYPICNLLGVEPYDLGYRENICLIEEASLGIILDYCKSKGFLKDYLFISTSGICQVEGYEEILNNLTKMDVILKCNIFYRDIYKVIIDSKSDLNDSARTKLSKISSRLGNRFIELSKHSIEDFYEDFNLPIYQAFVTQFSDISDYGKQGEIKINFANQICSSINNAQDFKGLFKNELDFLLKT